MTLYELNAFNEDEKANATWDDILISDREDSEYRIIVPT
jgi:hypothetical protein